MAVPRAGSAEDCGAGWEASLSTGGGLCRLQEKPWGPVPRGCSQPVVVCLLR